VVNLEYTEGTATSQTLIPKIGRKDNANRVQDKTNPFVFHAKVQLILSKDTASI